MPYSYRLSSELLAQRQHLLLITRPDAHAINLVRRIEQRIVHQPSDYLAVFYQERHLVRPYFQYRRRTFNVIGAKAEAGIEEPCIVDAKFADRRIKWDHLRRITARDADFLLAGQDIKIAGVKNQAV